MKHDALSHHFLAFDIDSQRVEKHRTGATSLQTAIRRQWTRPKYILLQIYCINRLGARR